MPTQRFPQRAVGANVIKANGTQSIPNNTYTGVDFTVERWDSHGFHDNVTNPSRFTIPPGLGGVYFCRGSVFWYPDANGVRRVDLLVNGTSYVGTYFPPPGSVYFAMEVSGVVHANPGDYIQLGAYQTSGNAVSIGDAGIGSFINHFSLVRIGAS